MGRTGAASREYGSEAARQPARKEWMMTRMHMIALIAGLTGLATAATAQQTNQNQPPPLRARIRPDRGVPAMASSRRRRVRPRRKPRGLAPRLRLLRGARPRRRQLTATAIRPRPPRPMAMASTAIRTATATGLVAATATTIMTVMAAVTERLRLWPRSWPRTRLRQLQLRRRWRHGRQRLGQWQRQRLESRSRLGSRRLVNSTRREPCERLSSSA